MVHWLEEKYGIIVTPGIVSKGGSDSRANAEDLSDKLKDLEPEDRQDPNIGEDYNQWGYSRNH